VRRRVVEESGMILFRSCPKCKTGDLVKTKDTLGEYMECAQCGYVRVLETTSDETEANGVIIPFPLVGWGDPPPRSA
jgi:hypothetical protein